MISNALSCLFLHKNLVMGAHWSHLALCYGCSLESPHTHSNSLNDETNEHNVGPARKCT